MTNASKLEEAVEYHERLKQLWHFKSGATGWQGAFTLSFGNYQVELSASTREQVDAAVAAEEKMLRNTLLMLGVALDDDPDEVPF